MALSIQKIPAITLTALALAACENGTPVEPASPPVAVESDNEGMLECRNGGDRLPLSGICRDAAIASLNFAGVPEMPLPEGCSWVVQETPFVDQFLLYLAAQCGDTTSRLRLEVGAQMAELYLEEAAISMPSDEVPVVRVISADPEQPLQNLQAFVRNAMQDEADAAECFARPAEMEGWPDDAIVVDVVQTADTVSDGPRSECGPYGLNEDETAYWRVFDDFSWYFSMGQDLYVDFDPQTFVLLDAASSSD